MSDLGWRAMGLFWDDQERQLVGWVYRPGIRESTMVPLLYSSEALGHPSIFIHHFEKPRDVESAFEVGCVGGGHLPKL